MSKHKPLVLQHLEEVSWKILEQYPHIVRRMIRGQAGIYVLYRRDKLYYVGLARNLMGRIKGHLTDRHHGLWDRFSVYLTIHDEHMKELESLLLRIIGPSGNKAGGKFSESISLLGTLNREMKEFDADRRAQLLGGSVARRRRRAKIKRGTGAIPLAGIVDRRIALQAEYRGRRFRATLRRDGKLSYGKKLYNTPTGAAKVVTGTEINGWIFWQYRDSGKWVPLSQIRE